MPTEYHKRIAIAEAAGDYGALMHIVMNIRGNHNSELALPQKQVQKTRLLFGRCRGNLKPS
jgi:hypothetical protein